MPSCWSALTGKPCCRRRRAMQTAMDPQGPSPRTAGDIFRRSQQNLGLGGGSGMARSRSAAALNKLAKPAVQVGRVC